MYALSLILCYRVVLVMLQNSLMDALDLSLAGLLCSHEILALVSVELSNKDNTQIQTLFREISLKESETRGQMLIQ